MGSYLVEIVSTKKQSRSRTPRDFLLRFSHQEFADGGRGHSGGVA